MGGTGDFSIQYVVVAYRRAAVTQPPRSGREGFQHSGVVKGSMGVRGINFITVCNFGIVRGKPGQNPLGLLGLLLLETPTKVDN